MAALLAVACGPRERYEMIHPEEGDGARSLFRVAFMSEVTPQEKFILRPDEYAGVAVDNARSLIYAGSRDGRLLALDQDLGGVVWEEDMGGPVAGDPLLTPDGRLVLGTDDGELIMLDLDTREPLWRLGTSGTVRQRPILHRGVVYFVNSRDEVRAVDARTGDHVWQHDREFQRDFTIYGKAGLAFEPSADPEASEVGTLYGGFDDGRVVAIGASSGSALWISNLAPPAEDEFADVDSTPLIDRENGQLVVACQSSGVHGLSLDDGSELWRLDVEAAGTVVKGPPGLYVFASALEGIFGIDTEGRVRWRKQFDPGTPSRPLLVDEQTIYLTHSNLGLLAYDAVSGEFLAGMETGSGMSSLPVWDPATQRLYAISNRGILFAMDLDVERWSIAPI
jgi:outer membrane protein assembly factor BamB